MSTSADVKSVTNLAAIVGRWKIKNGRAVCEGPERPEWPYGLCASNVRFLEGEAQVTVRRTKGAGLIDGRIVFGYRSVKHEYFTVGLHSEGKAFQIVNFNPAIGWYPIAEAGLAANLAVGRPITFRVLIRGQRVSLEVDGVRVLEYVLPMSLPYGQLGLYSWLRQGGGMEFTNFSANAVRGDAFVVMQFSGFEELYTDVIEPLTKQFGLRPYRADQVYGPGSILEDIIRGIETAQIVIAEITPTNENVFYEVGYAHALKKPTILLAEKDKKLPFDLSGFRCLFYENSIGGKRKVEEGLRKHLQAILDD
jgi:Nucleoside 2-deoxyribosyltransferase